MAHKEHQELIQKLSQCLAECEHCSDACLSEDNPGQLADCIRLDRDCADICGLSIRLISRGSRRASQVVDLCADFCRMCAEECEKYEHDHCQECARACRECEEACRQFQGVTQNT